MWHRRPPRLRREAAHALRQTVLARAPLAAMVGYASALRSLTAGEASLSMEFSHYARVEPAVQQQLLLQMRGYV